MKVKFDCGCEFDSNDGKNILLSTSVEDIPLNCPKTYELISKGLVKGCFQIEGKAGQRFSTKLKPENMDHLSALISIIRPGTADSIDLKTGKTLAEVFCERKNGTMEIDSIDESISDILEDTFQCVCYQEQIMQIAERVAGFNPEQNSTLRKAFSKKLPEVMAKCKGQFYDGITQVGMISREKGEELWGIIESSQKYSFNKSHAVSYSLTSYQTAYIKCHFPLEFYCGWLRFANEKPNPKEEISDLVSEAKLLDIEVRPPDLRNLQPDFYLDDGKIRFGLSNIKGVGLSVTTKLSTIAQGYIIGDLKWLALLGLILNKINSRAVQALISTGCLDYLNIPRNRLLFEYDSWLRLTSKEQEWIVERNFDSLEEALEKLAEPRQKIDKKEYTGGGCANVKRRAVVEDLVKLLKNPPYALVDSIDWICYTEQELLGLAITSHKTDAVDQSSVNCTCKEFIRGHNGYTVLGVSLREIKEHTIKKKGPNYGKQMAFLKIEDGSASLNAVIFNEEYHKFKHLLQIDNTVGIRGERGNEGGFVINNMWQIS